MLEATQNIAPDKSNKLLMIANGIQTQDLPSYKIHTAIFSVIFVGPTTSASILKKMITYGETLFEVSA